MRKWTFRAAAWLSVVALCFALVTWSRPGVTYAALHTISIDGDLSDWDGVNTYLGDPVGDLNGGHSEDLVKIWVASDSTNLYVRWDIMLGGQLTDIASTLYGLAFSSGGATAEGMAWVWFDSQGRIDVAVESSNGTQALPTTNAAKTSTGLTKTVTSVEAMYPFTDIQAVIPAFNPTAVNPIWAETHASASWSSNIKDRVPDAGYMNFNPATGDWTAVGTGAILTVGAAAAAPTAAVGGTATYTVTVGNTGTAAGTVTDVVFTLPAGFAYQSGTTSGMSTNDPAASGSTLTWSGLSASVPAGGSDTLTFSTTAGGTAGNTYYSQATANAGDLETGDTAPVTLEEPPPNTAPAAQASVESLDEDTDLLITLTATDDEDSSLTFSIGTQPAGGAVTNPGAASCTGSGPYTCTAEVTYTPDGNYAGADSFSFTASDGALTSDPATVSITVTAVNDPPTATSPNAGATEDTAKVITLTGKDVDDASLTFAPGDGPAHGTLGQIADPECSQVDGATTCTATVSYEPDPDYSGSDSFTYSVSDGNSSANGTVDISVAAVNDTPVLDDPADQEVTAGETVTLTVTATDVEGAVAYSLVDPPAGAAIDPDTGAFSWTPGAAGTYTITVRVTDGGGLTAEQSFVVMVNDPAPPPGNAGPAAASPGVSATEDTPYTITLTATDADSASLTFTPGDGPAHGTLGQISAPECSTAEGNTTCTATVTYTPGEQYSGPDSFTYTVSDGNSSAVGTVDIDVAAVNDSPVLDDPADQEVTAGETITLTATATDVEDAVTYSLVDPPAGAAIDPDTGAFSWTPGTAGTYTITVRVTDGGGLTDEQSFTVTVSEAAPQPGSVTGTITNPAAKPVGSLTVLLLDGDGNTVATTATGADGQYLFDEIPGGTYTVQVPTADPARPAASGSVTVPAGEEATLSLQVTSRAVLTLTADPVAIQGDGVSTSTLVASLALVSDGTPVAGVPVNFSATDGALSAAQVSTGPDGFATAILTAPQLAGLTDRQEQVLVSARDDDLGIFAEAVLTVTFKPAAIEGVVIDAGTGLPVAGATVVVQEDFDGDGTYDFEVTVTTGADGKYHILVPQVDWQYTTTVTAPMTVGNTVVMVTTNTKTAVGATSGGETVIAEPRVSGMVLIRGNPEEGPRQLQPGETVTAAIIGADGNPVNTPVSVNADGSFTIENPVPGTTYEILFQYTLEGGITLAGVTAEVTVGNNGELVLQTALIDPFGVVVDAVSGNPLTGVRMELYWANTPANVTAGRQPHTLVNLPVLPGFEPNENRVPQNTTSAGQYAWMVFADGDYYIKAYKAGYRSYDSRSEGRDVAGEDSYVTDGIIHVGQTIVEYNFTMTKATSGGG
ncbi:MAG TPA: tandem-95 repeat protein, partial [Symbiobacteriaceae bacterium]|nr:tandem-95 repeat protein [Symbiobacteriaceae bacterium]